MYFILFDPIFWINHTLSTLTRVVSKLQRQIEKVDAELEANKDIQSNILVKAELKTEKMADKANAKLMKIKTKASKKRAKVVDKADAQVNGARLREKALNDARLRASITAKNMDKLTKEEI